MNAPTACLQCLIPETGGPVCNPLLCPKTLQPAPARLSSRRQIRTVPPPRIHIPQKPLDIEPGEDDDDEYEAAAVPGHGHGHGYGTYRPVSNRAGKTVMARPGIRTCDPRCRNARGDVCVCSCNGRNHGAG